jgi:UDP-N-acetylglucosamine--N-acetylmuramyl-(pentapeptide) pyrophosphoryl-undecaprenol N-acetylglucosamine transferase
MAGPTIAFTGGGTGGHLYPGLAVAGALRARGFSGRMAWIGSTKESDRKIVEAEGIEFHAIPSGKLRRELSPKNAADAFRVLAGYFAARRVLKELRPALLFSKGGYVSVPPCAAAASLGIPYLTHESDLTPGLATRLNAGRAAAIVLSYEETRALLPASARERAVVAGNPVRAAIRLGDAARGRALLGLAEDTAREDTHAEDTAPEDTDPDRLPVIFFLGGSQGARQINELVAATLPRLEASAFVVHQTGAEAIAPPDGPRYRSFRYIREEMPDLLAAADLVVGRAGAGTLWESAALGKAMLLVPLCGSGTRGDQVDNAELFARAGAAVSLVGAEATPDRLASEALGLLGDRKRLAAAGEAAKALAGRDAASEIAELILKRIGEAQ